ncbi:MAG: MFS transporter [Candidatus Heimdallarchaeota archaeon]|nr:MFS transporter [Candidatus Heimdallarchaeota archaeon]
MKPKRVHDLLIKKNYLEESSESQTTLTYLNKRNISLIALGAFIWSIYLSIQGQYFNDYLLDMSNYSPLIVSLLVSLVALTGALVSIFTGAISDNLKKNFGRRKIFILTGGTTSAILLFFLPLSKSLLVIIGLNVLMSLFNTVAFICNNSLIPDIASNGKLGKANAYASLGSSVGTIAGFALMLISPSSNIFFATGAICAFGFIVVGIFFQEPKPKMEQKNWISEIKETFQFSEIKKEKSFFHFLASHFFLHTGINVYMPFLLIFLTQKNDPLSGELIGLGLSVQDGQVLLLFVVMTGISMFLALPIGFILDRTNKQRFLIVSRGIFSLSTAILALTPIFRSINPLVIGILFIIPFSFANTADIVSRGAYMHSIISMEKRGQLLGLLFFIKTLAQIPGVIIGGLFAHFFQNGYQYGFLIGSVFLVISIPFLITSGLSLNVKHTKVEATVQLK